MQLLRGLPGILSKGFPHTAPENRVRAVADFGVGVKQSKRSVGDCRSRCRMSRPAIGEQELAVLVVGTGRTCLHVDFVVIVLAGAFVEASKLQRVAAFDP